LAGIYRRKNVNMNIMMYQYAVVHPISGLIRGVAFGVGGLIRGVTFHGRGLIIRVLL
jgi:hypothetical protein